MTATLTDSRRLTGANLFWDHPSAIVDLAWPAADAGFIQRWKAAAAALLAAAGHAEQRLHVRQFDGGASLLISAPIDALYSMCELNEVAFAMAGAQQAAPDKEQIERLRKLFADEANPRLLALQAAAEQHDVPFLWDDDAVSVGHGASALVWPPDALPGPADVDWALRRRIPVALVTGTNGKSTTVRMAASILSAAGLRAGLTSTDWIRVGKNILDTGDYSGTGGARTLLRHPDTEVAVLETARGGLLRRGLGVDSAAACLITNVAADHLGDYGINTVDELRGAKFIVRRALNGDAPLILNADDEGMVRFAQQLSQPIIWTSLDANSALVQGHLQTGGAAAVLNGQWLELRHGTSAQQVLQVNDIPAAMHGAARHNIRNALGAMALCQVLGAPLEALRAGLQSFQGDQHDNPGRGNWFEVGGARILVDFAHNEHGLLALTDMLATLPAKRRIILLSQAGDRPDRDIITMTRVACTLEPQRLLVCDLPGYERGRQAGAVPAVIKAAAMDNGVAAERIETFDSPLAAARAALADLQEGDLVILLALTQRDKVLEEIGRLQGG